MIDCKEFTDSAAREKRRKKDLSAANCCYFLLKWHVIAFQQSEKSGDKIHVTKTIQTELITSSESTFHL